ncbi:MAG: hypothetical protein IJ424_01965 [Oscillospiraceae bacterium]|nr:hypothetical protein [Oscillospiraceae bacterium]
MSKKNRKKKDLPLPAEEAKEEILSLKNKAEAVTEEASENTEDLDSQELPLPIAMVDDAEKPVEVKAVESKKDSVKASIKELDGKIKETLDDALDENAEDLAQSEPETVSETANISLKQVATTIFGFAVMVFAIIGIIATANRINDYIAAQSDDTKLIKTFESLVMPLTACDAAVFEDVSALSEDVILTAACWDVILNPSSTFTLENGYYTVSYLDIDVRIAKLFGTGLTYSHKTVGDSEILFEYNEQTSMYSIPAFPKTVAYLPVLESYTKTDDGYELKVNYVYPVTTIISNVNSAEKVMIFNVKSKDLGYVITSLKIGDILTGQEL